MFKVRRRTKDIQGSESAGSKGAMRKMVGYGLSDLKWKGASWDNDEDYYNIRVMKKALWARFQQDKRFREIVSKKDVRFEHYQKPRGAFNPDRIPDWGCYYDAKHTKSLRGLNILGNLLNELNEYNAVPSFFEVNGRLNWSGETPKRRANAGIHTHGIHMERCGERRKTRNTRNVVTLYEIQM